MSQVLSIVPGAYSAYGTWVLLHPLASPAPGAATQTAQQSVPAMSLVPVNRTAVFVTFIVFATLFALWAVFSVASFLQKKPAINHDHVGDKPSPLRVLERYYVALASFRDHVKRMLWLDKENQRHGTDLYALEVSFQRMQRELIDLAPSILATSAAFEFQTSSAVSSYGEIQERLPRAVDELMSKVHTQWSRQAEKVGIAPLRFKEVPIVKLEP